MQYDLTEGLESKHLLSKLKDSGWKFNKHGSEHDEYIHDHPAITHKIQMPRHKNISPGVANRIMKDIKRGEQNAAEYESNTVRESALFHLVKTIIKEAIKKRKKVDDDKFIANPNLTSDIMKEN